MYVSFFGLKREPFSIAPDPRYLFMSERHREALAHLLYGVNGGGGFVLLTGEVGAGKTTVCRCFLEQIPRRCNVAYIFNPKLTVPELLQSVCEEFGVPHPAGSASVKAYLDPLNEFLLKTHAVGQNSVLIIDEAQMLSAEVLEQLRLLTNLETNERKLLQIILIGQPELRELLARPELEQLAQRVVARYHLGAMSEAETDAYIRHRLSVAGLKGANPFDADAVARIHRLSRGVPRRVNLLCDRALLGAYSQGKGQVVRATVDKAGAEVFFTGRSRRRSGAGALAGLAAIARAAGTDGRSRRLALAGIAGVTLLAAALAVGWQSASKPGTAGAAERSAAASATGPAASASAASGGRASGVPLTLPRPSPDRPAGEAVALRAADAGSLGAVASGAGAGVGASAGASASASLRVDGTSTAAAADAAAPAAWTAATLRNRLQAAGRTEPDAWRELARAWKLTLGTGDPCAAAERLQVQCFRSTGTTLALIRLLDRPGIVALYGSDGRAIPALLTGLSAREATLQIRGVDHSVPLPALASLWRGEFATYWRAPLSYIGRNADTAAGPVAEWIDEQLAALQGPAGAAPASAPRSAASAAERRTRVAAFQVSQGLPADGLVGPATFMQLNRATGVDEPRLSTAVPIASATSTTPAPR